jgi:hypothetical protein
VIRLLQSKARMAYANDVEPPVLQTLRLHNVRGGTDRIRLTGRVADFIAGVDTTKARRSAGIRRSSDIAIFEDAAAAVGRKQTVLSGLVAATSCPDCT